MSRPSEATARRCAHAVLLGVCSLILKNPGALAQDSNRRLSARRTAAAHRGERHTCADAAG